MEIKELLSRTEWDHFLAEAKPHTFLQSWNWGNFNESMGEKVFRLGIFADETLIGICLAIKVKARRGSFLLVPHGPILNQSLNIKNQNEILNALTNYLKILGRNESCSFIRINPALLNTEENKRLFKELGFRKAPLYVHAELLWILDISKNEATLLREMRKTSRYSINKAIADGVTVEKSEDPKDLEKFQEVYESTFTRQHFVPFSKKYLEREFAAFSPDKKIAIFFAKYQREIVSSAIIVYEKNEAFYHHGASNQKFPKITPTHLLQWEIIKDAKARGCAFYNFWGIAPEGKPKHPMFGLSLFKKGFGGFLEELLPAQDLIITPKYWLNFAVEKIRKIRRGL